MPEQDVVQILRDAAATDAQRDAAYSVFKSAKSWGDIKSGLDRTGLAPEVKVSIARAWAPVAQQVGAKPLAVDQTVGSSAQVPTVRNEPPLSTQGLQNNPSVNPKPNGEPPSFLSQVWNEGVVNPAKQLAAGYFSSAAGGAKALANAADIVGKVTGTPPGGMFRNAQRYYESQAQEYGGGRTDIPSQVYRGVGAVPGDLAKIAVASTPAGPVAGMAALGAVENADQGVVPAIAGAGQGALMGAGMHYISPASMPVRVGGNAAMFAAPVAAQGGSAEDVTAAAITGGLLGIPGGKGQPPKRSAKSQRGKNVTPKKGEPEVVPAEPPKLVPVEEINAPENIVENPPSRVVSPRDVAVSDLPPSSDPPVPEARPVERPSEPVAVGGGEPPVAASEIRPVASEPPRPQTNVEVSPNERAAQASAVSEGQPAERAVDAGTIGVGQEIRGASSDVPQGMADRTKVYIPGKPNEPYQARYELRELGDINASHSGISFSANERYGHKNDRDYSDPRNQRRIIDDAAQFIPEYLITDNTDALNGPPVIDPKGNTVGGNSRVMKLERVYQYHPNHAKSYKSLLARKAAQYGVDPAQVRSMKQPVLVRVLDESHMSTPEDVARAITDFNKEGTAKLTASERGTADARYVSPKTLNFIAQRMEGLGEDATLLKAMEGKYGPELIRRLVDDGVITEAELPQYQTRNLKVTPEGKIRVARLVTGRIFKDSEQFDSVPDSLRNKIERIAPDIMRTADKGEWDVLPKVQDALDLLSEYDPENWDSIEQFQQQQGLFTTREYSPETVRLAYALMDDTPTKLAKAFKKYAQAEVEARPSEQAGFEGMEMDQAPKKTPQEAFDEAFPKPNSAPPTEKPLDLFSSEPPKFMGTSLEPPKPPASKPEPRQNLSQRYEGGEIGHQVASDLGVARSTAYRWLKEDGATRSATETKAIQSLDRHIPRTHQEILNHAEARVYPGGDFDTKKPSRMYINDAAYHILKGAIKALYGNKGEFGGMHMDNGQAMSLALFLRDATWKGNAVDSKGSVQTIARQLAGATGQGRGVAVIRIGDEAANLPGARTIARHELTHSAMDYYTGLISDVEVKGNPTFRKVSDKLSKHIGSKVSPDIVAQEIVTYTVTGMESKLGLSEQEARDAVLQIVQRVAEQGGDALRYAGKANREKYGTGTVPVRQADNGGRATEIGGSVERGRGAGVRPGASPDSEPPRPPGRTAKIAR